jgi:hypothetical protein
MYKPGTILVSDKHLITKCRVISHVFGVIYEIEILSFYDSLEDQWKIGDVKNLDMSEYKLDETLRVKEILERYED